MSVNTSILERTIIFEKLDEIHDLCRKHNVQRLELFGSALGDDFAPERSDLDFLVVYEPQSPDEHYENFFGLGESLQAMFGRDIDLVEKSAVKNPTSALRSSRRRLPCMSPRSLGLYLSDTQYACRGITAFASGKTIKDDVADRLLRSAIERQLTFVGEAMVGVKRLDPSVAAQLPESDRIISFRNVLVQHYFEIEDDVVWVIVTRRVPDLLATVNELLSRHADQVFV